MTQAADCSDLIESHIDNLEDVYGSFPVNQTTISLPDERFERARASRDSQIDAYVEIHNDDSDVLHVRQEESVELPSASISADGSIDEQVERRVREQTGVECTLDSIERATIAGIRNADSEDSETVYLLVVVFSGHRESGRAVEDAFWQSAPEEIRPAYA